MISMILAFITFSVFLIRGTVSHARRIEETKAAYRNEGIDFPFGTMAAVQNQMLFHQKKFLDSEDNENLRNERIELLNDYKISNLHPLKMGAFTLLISLPIEVVGWILIY